MPNLRFLTFDFGSSKKRGSLLAEDRKTQIIQNIEQNYPEKPAPTLSFWLIIAVLFSAAGVATFSFIRYAVVQKNNFSLNDQVKKLNRSIQVFEKQNKDLSAKIGEVLAEKQQLKDAINTVKKENESIRFEAKKSEARAVAAIEEKTYLEDMLINKTKELEKLNTPGVLSTSSRDEEIKALQQQNATLNEKLQKLYQATDAKMKEINIAKITLEDTIAGAKKVIEDEYSSINLGSIAVNTQSVAIPVGSTAPDSARTPIATPRTAAKTNGRVLAINEDHGFVVVDLGKVDGLQNGMNLYLKKNGETIATLSILEVRDVMTACNVRNLTRDKKIEINDLVSVKN
ncbi:MAG: hypothetical protein AUJ72_00565 [Candidatus Omnitrophica bacterium CG1_02_46_14]|nr:MAG: hypothetical protein AUJ72_00565 [Candidatus Omnitrophica bacterium CG1_02_46_14]